MIRAIIEWSIQQRLLVLLATVALVVAGLVSLRQTPVDAIPDLSEVQVIIKTSYPGQAPQVVEDQVTYPLTTAMLSVPGATTVRGFSFFGDSYVYVLFEEGTDMYWARSRVLEYLNQVRGRLPSSASPELGPDATGVGWVFMYALTDRSGQHDLAQLRSLQDWFLRYELQTVPGVSEVATVGGMVRQYQVQVDPERLRAYGIPLQHVRMAIEQGNQQVGASVIEMAEAEYMVVSDGYLDGVDDLKSIPLGTSDAGTPLQLEDVAQVQLGPQMRRGVADLNGEGEVVGGIIVMRYGENAARVIADVKDRLSSLQESLPPGVDVVTVYDRSRLISNAVSNLWQKLGQEFLIVALVCIVFLFHVRSSLVAIISLPVGILVAFIIMRLQGINANIMSLGGIAIAIGAMVDGAIVMIENMHKQMEKTPLTADNRWQIVARSAGEVGPALFFSLLIITLSFLPVFALEAQEGRMFSPLAFTKTYAMAASAGLAITLVPVLMGYCIRGRVRPEARNPVNRFLISVYRPVINTVLRFPAATLVIGLLLMLVGLWPATQIGSEFMPPLDEGDLMYMPTTYPAVSIGEARQILQQTDRLIKTLPEVKTVFGKVGRAETATDPAPLTMIETFIQLRPRSEWRAGMTTDDLIAELTSLVNFPGLSNAFVMPIKTRIDMLSTGIKTPVGIKVAGPELETIQSIGRRLENILAEVPGTASVYSERVAGGRYVKVDIRRGEAARHGLNIADVQQVIASAIGGINVTETVEGLERYPVNLRFPQRYRDSVTALSALPIVTPSGERIALGDVATIGIEGGPPAIKSENARLNGWTLVDLQDVDLGSYVEAAQAAVEAELELPTGYSLSWSGQYEYMLRVEEKLRYLVPVTLAIIVLLLYLNFRSLLEVGLILLTLPLALAGGLWLMFLNGFNFSVAVGVGFIALAGVAVEIGVIMLVYLNLCYRDRLERCRETGRMLSVEDLRQGVIEGALLRVRPVMMTTVATIAGLLPIYLGGGAGGDMTRRIAAPMVGGMVSALVLTLVLLPCAYFVVRRLQLKRQRTGK